ncbi:hypothetical protein BV25DRAFT_1819196 [Artomyces pyxidatus]|uniref:Uncharacterized protein n=1 Tax=Artomyces pyxidatus TaxID=48021 RepID=A0ACB8THA4_9AGAM|nr:hypothetical protein BV25DRAFT_1819196 [Artomyces pyxidatus]
MDRLPHQPTAPPQYVSRKTLAIKRVDSETLTREDVQYDLLYYIFTDQSRVFTDETPGKPSRVNFCDLYVNALYNSTKCSKVMRDKMHETPAFAVEFAKISLLTNVGRINTTMAFFPEMKTALRSYHPVPSLQKTDGNVQDAPRIKNCLKAALLPSEQKTAPPSTPADILARVTNNHVPPTSIVNLIFVLTNYSTALSPTHFDPPVEFVDLFLPINISSAARARAFLWMIFHYHEGPQLPNPFADDYSRRRPGKVPWLHRLSPEEYRKENIDPPEEIEWGKKMAAQRSLFLQELVSGGDPSRRSRVTSSSSTSHDAAAEASARRSRTQQYYTQENSKTATFHHYIPTDRGKTRPPPPPPSAVNASARTREAAPVHRQEWSMLQQAWHKVQTVDPLVDSDDEGVDELTRLDYQRRLYVLDSLRRPRGQTPALPHDNYPRSR